MARRGGERQPGAPWTVDELAKALRVSPAHLYVQVQKEAIPAIKIGAVVRIPDRVARRLLGEEQPAS